MKFKIKGPKVISNRLVNMRVNMKNDANYSLFTNKERYRLKWNLSFNDDSISNRFLRDCEDQAYSLNKKIMIPKWLGVYVLFTISLSNDFEADLNKFSLFFIIPLMIDLLCIKMAKTLIYSRLYFTLLVCSMSIMATPSLAYPFVILCFLLDFVTITPFWTRTAIDTFFIIVSYLCNTYEISQFAVSLFPTIENHKSDETIKPMNYVVLFLNWIGISFVYAISEVYCKNQWVGKDISRKGEKVLFKMIDDNSSNIVVVDKQGKFLYFMNSNAQKLILRLHGGNIPNSFTDLVSEQCKSKFNDLLNNSFRSVETQIFQINLSYIMKSDKIKGIKVKFEDKGEEEIIQECFEMQMNQMRWDNKKCIMLTFHSFQRHIEENSRLQIQSQSIMDKITDLVDKIEMKYACSKEVITENDNIENMFYKGLILSTNRIQNEFSIVNECLRIKNNQLENKREPLLLIETFINTIDLVSMDLKRGIRIEINNDVCLPTYVRCDKDKFITILSAVLEICHTLCKSKSAIVMKVRLERMDHNKKIYYISFEINFEYINNLDRKENCNVDNFV